MRSNEIPKPSYDSVIRKKAGILKGRASLAAQLVKNLPATQETPIQLLGEEDSLEKG